MHAPEDCRILEAHAAARAAIERLLQKLRFVDVRKDLGDRVPRDVACDAEPLDLPDDARAAAMLDPRFGVRAGERGAAVVERALLAEPRDRRVDVVGIEFAAGEPDA